MMSRDSSAAKMLASSVSTTLVRQAGGVAEGRFSSRAGAAREARRVQGERPLHADPVADAPDGERLAHSPALAPDDDALEGLDALAAALDHLQMHPHGVTGGEDGDLPLQLLALDDRYLVHADILRSPAGVAPTARNYSTRPPPEAMLALVDVGGGG